MTDKDTLRHILLRCHAATQIERRTCALLCRHYCHTSLMSLRMLSHFHFATLTPFTSCCFTRMPRRRCLPPMFSHYTPQVCRHEGTRSTYAVIYYATAPDARRFRCHDITPFSPFSLPYYHCNTLPFAVTPPTCSFTSHVNGPPASPFLRRLFTAIFISPRLRLPPPFSFCFCASH